MPRDFKLFIDIRHELTQFLKILLHHNILSAPSNCHSINWIKFLVWINLHRLISFSFLSRFIFQLRPINQTAGGLILIFFCFDELVFNIFFFGASVFLNWWPYMLYIVHTDIENWYQKLLSLAVKFECSSETVCYFVYMIWV